MFVLLSLRELFTQFIHPVHVLSKGFMVDLNAKPTGTADFIDKHSRLLNVVAHSPFAKYIVLHFFILLLIVLFCPFNIDTPYLRYAGISVQFLYLNYVTVVQPRNGYTTVQDIQSVRISCR